MRKSIMITALAVGFGMIGCGVQPADETATTAAPPTVAAKSKKARTSFGDGTYKVGSEIKPGQYQTTVRPDQLPCYWERLRGTSGDPGEIIANDNVTGKSLMTVKKTDKYIHFLNGCKWSPVAKKAAQ